MLKELKEDMEKVNKITCDHNGNSNKEIEKPKKKLNRNSGVEKQIIEMKNLLEVFKGRFDQTEEKNHLT